MNHQNAVRCLNIRSIRRAAAVVALATLGWAGAEAQTPLPIYEPFPSSYTNSSDETIEVPAGGSAYRARRLGNGDTATIWSIGNSAGGGSTVVVGGAAALSYPSLYQDPNPNLGLYIRTANTTANRTRGILFPAISGGRAYVSFLMDVQQAPSGTDSRLFAKLDYYSNPVINNSPGSSSMAGIWLTPGNTLAISKSSNAAIGADSTTPLAPGTHLVVLRYQFNPDVDDDEVALWVDPGSLNAAEGDVPAPALTLAAGADVPSLSSFLIYHVGTEVVASMFLDEFRIATTWAEATSTQALCVAASISTHPADQTVNEGIGAIVSVIAGGSSPAYQWQVSTDSGATWENVADGVGGTTPTYWTRPTTPADHGNQYRAIVTVGCNGGSSATSSAATLAVTPATATPAGLVVDDLFQDYLYNNLPYDVSNSVWFASTASSLDASSGLSMMGTVASGSSVLWLGYFTDDSAANLPVHLGVGHALKGTLEFKASNITSSGGSVRIGFFDYADGGTRVLNDGFGSGSTGNGQNVRGYMAALNFGLQFSGNPFSLYARNNLGSGDLMGTTGNYLGLGGGPANLNGEPAFQNDTPYTLEFTIDRKSLTSVQVTTAVSGGGTNWSHSVTDNTYAYPRFDCIGFRAGNLETAGSPFEFTRFRVEVLASTPDPIPLIISSSGGGIQLEWSNPAFRLQSALDVNGTYGDVSDASSPYPISATESRMFYRLIWVGP